MFRAIDAQQPRPRRTTAGTFLRVEVADARRLLLWWPIWLLLALFLGTSVAAYQVPHTYTIDVGSPSDEAYVRNFHARLSDGNSGPTYRWTDVYGYVLFPGLGGSRPFTATITFDTARSAPVQIFVNGEQIVSSNFTSGWRTVSLRIDSKHPQALQSRDTVVEFRSSDYRTEDSPTESKGVKVAALTIEQDSAGGFIVPALAPLLWLLLALLLGYLAVGRALFGVASTARARLWALMVTLLGAAGLVATLAASHIGVAVAAEHLAITLLTTLTLAVVCELVLSMRAAKTTAIQSRVLALIFAGAFLLRYAGMALPQSVIIDMPYHMKWLTTLLSGDWQSLYFPGGLSAVPREWGMDLLIPKSPLFYAIFAPLNILPFELETSVKWLICLLDASVVPAVFWLSMRVQRRVGAGLVAAALYAVMPLDFRAFSYGILPTILSQWLATLFLLAIVATSAAPRWTPALWVGLVLLACLVFLSFPTVAVFVTLIGGGYLLALLLWKRYYSGAARWASGRLAAVLVIAWLLAIWAYYGLYISPVLASAQALLAPKADQAATVKWPGGFSDVLAFTADYVVTLLPVLLALAGFGLLLLGARRSTGQRRALLLLLLWAAIGPIFVLVNYKVDMIGKHLFFTMLPIALAGGVALYRLGGKGRWGTMLAANSVALITLQAVAFWIQRLVETST